MKVTLVGNYVGRSQTSLLLFASFLSYIFSSSLFLPIQPSFSRPLIIYSGFLKRLLDTINFFPLVDGFSLLTAIANSLILGKKKKEKKKKDSELDSISIIYCTCP